MLPHDLPPWTLIWHYIAHWKKQGVWVELNEALRNAVRLKAGGKTDCCDPRLAKCANN